MKSFLLVILSSLLLSINLQAVEAGSTNNLQALEMEFTSSMKRIDEIYGVMNKKGKVENLSHSEIASKILEYLELIEKSKNSVSQFPEEIKSKYKAVIAYLDCARNSFKDDFVTYKTNITDIRKFLAQKLEIKLQIPFDHAYAIAQTMI